MFSLCLATLLTLSCEGYLKQASRDVAVYSKHAGRQTVDVDDVKLLMRRQREITSTSSFEYLVNTHLPLEYIEELLLCTRAVSLT